MSHDVMTWPLLKYAVALTCNVLVPFETTGYSGDSEIAMIPLFLPQPALTASAAASRRRQITDVRLAAFMEGPRSS
jgi:hypothetical protein